MGTNNSELKQNKAGSVLQNPTKMALHDFSQQNFGEFILWTLKGRRETKPDIFSGGKTGNRFWWVDGKAQSRDENEGREQGRVS